MMKISIGTTQLADNPKGCRRRDATEKCAPRNVNNR